MVYASQNNSGEFSTRKCLIVFASVFEIMCPGPDQVHNNLSHTVKIMVYIYIMFGHLFDSSIKIVNWLLNDNLREPGKLKLSRYLHQTEKYPKSGSIFWIFTRHCMDVGSEILL